MDKEWVEIRENQFIKDFYDFRDRLAAVIVTNGISVLIKCDFEFHYLIADDFLKSGDDYSFVECGRIFNGHTVFTSDAEHTFDVSVLEQINKKMIETLS